MGAKESIIAFHIGYLLYQYMEAAGVSGVAMGEAGALRLLKGLVRIPDLSLFLEKNLPGGKMSEEPITPLAPDLAIEVLSRSNTRREMERKLKDYFLFGIKLVWYVDPVRRVVRVFTSPEDVKELGKNEILDGGEVLPGFRLPVSRFFEKLETLPASKAKPKRNRPR
jgi:Uma2 family endonuclease